jgi:hypothetical protein
MRRRRGGAILRAAAVASAVAFAASFAGPAQARDYFPAGNGMSWTYSSGETQVLSGPRDLNGLSVMVLTHYLQGIPVSEDYLVFDGTSVLTVGTASGGTVVRFEPPLVVYGGSPLQVGDQWQSTTDLGDFSITLASEVLGMRGVQTTAGRFNALQIRQRTLTSTGASTVLDIYFVPGVGIVRFVTQDGTVVDLIEYAL